MDEADYYSVFCDGSTDKSEREKVVMVKILEDFYSKIKFLKLEEPPNTKAEGVLQATANTFADFGQPHYKQKLVGFCSDSANVMMGNRRGVIMLLKERRNADWLLSIWRFAH